MSVKGVQIQTFTDLPIENVDGDKLGIKPYAEGLTEFIKSCNTPMTIAIQGDWGSGKTSTMNMVRKDLEKNVKTIWFNTWQYSQFNSGEQLSVLFINDLVDNLAAEDPASEELKKTAKFLKLLTAAMVHKVAGSEFSELVKEKWNEVKTASEIMVNFKTQFQECINRVIKKKNIDRVVVFVDDLDRLRPSRAVELLEILKLFLDCKNCVYVLAIDYDVVLKGTREKFGDMEEEKGRSFFDKIIQVPFKMPIANLKTDAYIEDLLNALSIHISEEEKRTRLCQFIKDTVGNNPRSMKRLFNLYSLNRIVSNIGEDQQKQSILLALLCLQHSYDDLYDFIAEYRKELSKDEFISLGKAGALGDMDDMFSKGLEKHHIDEENWDKNAALMEAFNAIAAQSKTLSEKDVIILKDVIEASSITAVGNRTDEKKSNRADYCLDESFEYYKISEPIEKTQQTTWNSARIQSFILFGQRYEATKFSVMLVKALSGLYKKDPEGFMKVRQECTASSLITLFYGSKKIKMKQPLPVPETNIEVETYTDNNYKVRQLNALMKEMGLDPGELSLELKLAHTVDSADAADTTTN